MAEVRALPGMQFPNAGDEAFVECYVPEQSIHAALEMTRSALVAETTLYLNGNGTDTATTGTGIDASIGYRFGFIAPYIAYTYFQWSGDCTDTALSAAQRGAGKWARFSVLVARTTPV